MISACRRFYLSGALLDAIVEGPPADATDVWFFDDLCQLNRTELQELRRLCQLRLLLTRRHERERWPHSWVGARLQRIEDELRGRG